MGNITRCLKHRKVKNSNDGMADEQVQQTDNKSRAYAVTMAGDLDEF